MRKETVTKKRLLELKNLPSDQNEVDIIFKEIFTLNNKKDRLELVKQVMAFANSEGGYIIYGVNSKNEWTGMDERSDDNIINSDFYNIFEKYLSHQIQISSNLIELDANYYFIIHINPINDAIVSFAQDGNYNLKSWGTKQEKSIEVFKKGTSFYRKDKKTVVADESFISAKKAEIIQTSKNNYFSFIGDHIETGEAFAKKPTTNVALPNFITEKIKRIVSLKNEIAELDNKNKQIGDLDTLELKIQTLHTNIDQERDAITHKEIQIIKFNENLKNIELNTQNNHELEKEFYSIMDLKKQSIYDKNLLLNEQIGSVFKQQILDLHKDLTNQLKYNWEKGINEISKGLVDQINQNNKIISVLKEKLNTVDLDEIAALRQQLEQKQNEFALTKNNIVSINDNKEKIKHLNTTIAALKAEIDADSAVYMSELISKEFSVLNELDCIAEPRIEAVDTAMEIEFISSKDIAIDNISHLSPICVS